MIKPWRVISRKDIGEDECLLIVLFSQKTIDDCDHGCVSIQRVEFHVHLNKTENEDDVIIAKLREHGFY